MFYQFPTYVLLYTNMLNLNPQSKTITNQKVAYRIATYLLHIIQHKTFKCDKKNNLSKKTFT